jgi:hypothetical protein
VARLGAVVFLLHLGVGDRMLARVVAQVRPDQDLLARHVDLGLHLGLLGDAALLRFLRHHLAVHELVAHHGAELLGVLRAALLLLLDQHVQARLRHRHAVHGGDGLPRRGFGGGFFLAGGGLLLAGERGLRKRNGRGRERGKGKNSNIH